ncbi:queuosine biosynthesis protein QueD [Legionella wadsworthii]|uniref:6-carboxy-5,6,7,8-tetrahydropterin synthase n=1 Tax=Legionella wadsworthii TaxID=28088 RepID=A0A378LRL1_9GAMM|nr:6-carboxytetrahydropterin synthase [Legionella wadsworthii]STY28449.1 queuosine biosynthesis protein QueD [Legionella wadsworthii]
MHRLMLRKNFIAQHFLTGKDFGPENSKHSHHYSMELEIENRKLDQFNFLIDIVDVKEHLDDLISYFNDKTLNELPEFKNQNPSLELFSKILWQKLSNQCVFPEESQITVKLWEDDIAQATYRER